MCLVSMKYNIDGWIATYSLIKDYRQVYQLDLKSSIWSRVLSAVSVVGIDVCAAWLAASGGRVDPC